MCVCVCVCVCVCIIGYMCECTLVCVLWYSVVCAFTCVCMCALYMYCKYILLLDTYSFHCQNAQKSQSFAIVAAELGQHWRSVGTYLGLQHWQLEQACVESKLEERAMEALVMWLRGQGDSDKPRSWKTVLEALRLAGQNDMAAQLERKIKEGRLLQR